jgi:hypothetical protein
MASSNVSVLIIVNKVLERLRESTVGGLTETSYAGFVLGLLNDARREVEQAYNWDALTDVVPVSTVASQDYINVAGGGFTTNERTRIIEVYNSTTDTYLRKRGLDYVRQMSNNDSTEAEPVMYAEDGQSSSQDLKLVMWQIPDQIYAMQIACYNPQDDFSTSDNATTDILRVPWLPVYHRTLTLAIRERGDDGGFQYEEVYQEYLTALNDAIAYEQRRKFDGTGFSGDWYVP